MLDLVSVIVPVYNSERYIARCIESIINQTYRNIEIIIINDGSTDKSVKIIEEYLLDHRIFFIDKDNEGLSKTRQLGIDKSNGKYICTVDSDDCIESDFINLMYDQIIKYDSDICVCASRHIDDKVSRVYTIDGVPEVNWLSTKNIEHDYCYLLDKYFMSDSWNKMYKKSFIINSGIKFELPKKYKGNDLLFNHLLILHKPTICIINKPIYNYYIYADSMSHKASIDQQEGFFYIFRRLDKEIKKKESPDVIHLEMSRLYIKFMYIALTSILKSDVSSKEIKILIKKFHTASKNFQSSNNVVLRIKSMRYISLKFLTLCFKSNSKFWLQFYVFTKRCHKRLLQRYS